MAVYDAQSQNTSSRNTRQYVDLDLFFQKKIPSGDVNQITEVQAVKRSVRNLVLLNPYEKPFHPEIGSNVRDLLFEPMTPLTEVFLAKKIEEVLINHEPRVRLVRVNVNSNPEQNRYRVWIEFYVVNHPEPVTVETFLERLR